MIKEFRSFAFRMGFRRARIGDVAVKFMESGKKLRMIMEKIIMELVSKFEAVTACLHFYFR